MDFQGQRLAELFFYWIILSFGSVGWVIGYFQQDFTIVFQSWLVGVLLSVVVGRPVAASLVAFLVCWNDHAFIIFFLLFVFHATALRPGLAFLQPTSRDLAWIGSGPKATHQIILNISRQQMASKLFSISQAMSTVTAFGSVHESTITRAFGRRPRI